MRKIVFVLTTLLITSCGEAEEKKQINLGDYNSTESADTTTDTDTSSSTTTQAENGVVEVHIEGNDQMQFNKKEITVQAGQTIKLTLEHVGQLPETVMGHNFVLLKEGTDVTAFAQKAAQAADNEYIPEGTNNVIANTEIIGGGESTTIEFQAPGPGTYTFICSFPGHYVMMQGEFIVE